MPGMGGGLLLALTLLGTPAHEPQLALELRVFNGAEDVTAQTRVAVHRAGDRTRPLILIEAGHAVLSADVPPGIYDVQAIREREGRVVAIRWAERLVVMKYPDEHGRHLEVINFQPGFGALEVRGAGGIRPDAEVTGQRGSISTPDQLSRIQAWAGSSQNGIARSPGPASTLR